LREEGEAKGGEGEEGGLRGGNKGGETGGGELVVGKGRVI